jgi:hypothetical protein
VSGRVFLLGQYQINDLVPFPSAHVLFSNYAFPYQFLSLGQATVSPNPGLIDQGALVWLFGAPTAQHLFIIGSLFVAGASSFGFFQKLDYPRWACYLGAFLYEASPAIVNQFFQGGPGILLSAAFFPLVVSNVIFWDRESMVRHAALAGALIVFVSYFNPQFPILLGPLIALLLIGLVRSNGWKLTLKMASVLLGVALIGALPVEVSLVEKLGLIHQSIPSLLHQQVAERRPNTLAELFGPYLFIGILPCVAGIIIALKSTDSFWEEYVAYTTLEIIIATLLYQHYGSQIIHYIAFLGLFKDFIKFRVLLGFPVVIMTMYALTRTPRLLTKASSWWRFSLIGCILLVAVGPIVVHERTELFSGTLGLTAADQAPNTYQAALNILDRLDPNQESYRILWVPQDLRVDYVLSNASPQRWLLYSAAGSPAAESSLLQTYRYIVNGEPSQIAASLAGKNVKYIVVNKSYILHPRDPGIEGTPTPGNAWEISYPSIAAVGGSQVLAGGSRYYLQTFSQSPGLRVKYTTSQFVIYQNEDYRPIISHYRGILVVHNLKNLTVTNQKSFRLKWSAYPWVSYRAIPHGFIVYPVPETNAWSPITATVPVQAGQSYIVSGQITDHHVRLAHVKVVWNTANGTPITVTYIIVVSKSSSDIHFSSYVTAPPRAASANLMLMGGWVPKHSSRKDHDRYTTFRNMAMGTEDDNASFTEVTRFPSELTALQQEFPALLVESRFPPHSLDGEAVYSLNESLTTNKQSVILIPPAELRISGLTGQSFVPGTGYLDAFTLKSHGTIRLNRQALSMISNHSKLIWVENNVGRNRIHEAASTETITCKTKNTFCRIFNVALVPKSLDVGASAVHKSLTTLGYAFSPYLSTSTNGKAIKYPGNWRTFYKGMATFPNLWDFPSSRRTLAINVLAQTFILGTILLSCITTLKCFLRRRRSL